MESTASEHSQVSSSLTIEVGKQIAGMVSTFSGYEGTIDYIPHTYYSECGEHSLAHQGSQNNSDSTKEEVNVTAAGSEAGQQLITVFHSNNEKKFQYQMVLELGQGTTSKVYLGFLDKDPMRPAAIKIFKPEFLTSSEKATEIFGNEIRALLSLDHPNIVKVYDYGVNGRILLFQPETSSV